MAATRVEESFIEDAMTFDDYEYIPGGGAVSYRDIKKFRDVKDFNVVSDEGEDLVVKYDQSILDAYSYYYEIWENFNEGFGLPSGGPWVKEPKWILTLIKMFNFIYREIEVYNRRGK